MHLLVPGGQFRKAVFYGGNITRGSQRELIDGIKGSSQEMVKTHSHSHAHLVIVYKRE